MGRMQYILMIVFAAESDENFNIICGAVLNFLYLALPYNITLRRGGIKVVQYPLLRPVKNL